MWLKTLALSSLLLFALPAMAQDPARLTPLVLEGERYFALQWQAGDTNGRSAVHGVIRNEYGFGAQKIRLLIDSLDAAGGVVVNTQQGSVRVWRATGGLAFTPGANVRVRVRVQPLDVVLIAPGQPAGSAPVTIEPAASPRTEPGDYAVVMGRVLAVDPSGRLTVESARGPVIVQIRNVTRYKVGDTVEVRTALHPA